MQVENTNTTTVEPSASRVIVEVSKLREIEQNILNYMLLSPENFSKIKSLISVNDFTFLVHQLIFERLMPLEDMLLERNYYQADKIGLMIEVIAQLLEEKENIKSASTLHILSQTPSANIEKDLEIINHYAMEKEIAINSSGIEVNGSIETVDGTVWFNFIEGRLVHVETSNITKLPHELCDTFDDTMKEISKLNLQTGDNELKVSFYGDMDEPDGIASLYLRKDGKSDE